MAYIDKVFYDEVYFGEPVDAAQFNKLAARASESVDQLTNFEIAAAGLDTFPPIIAERVKKAVAAQVEFLAAAGATATNYQKTTAQSVGIGKFSVTPGGSVSGLNGSSVSSGMITHLSSAGLLYAGVGVNG